MLELHLYIEANKKKLNNQIVNNIHFVILMFMFMYSNKFTLHYIDYE